MMHPNGTTAATKYKTFVVVIFGLSFGGNIRMRQIIAPTIFSSAHARETNSGLKFAIR